MSSLVGLTDVYFDQHTIMYGGVDLKPNCPEGAHRNAQDFPASCLHPPVA